MITKTRRRVCVLETGWEDVNVPMCLKNSATMTVGELKKYLDGYADDVPVVSKTGVALFPIAELKDVFEVFVEM